jgi:NADPH-dependent glutamate synthase beta subunit-like oxidoreductase
MATGSAIGKKLGIPGEDLANSISAAQFVPWYNGHPDYAEFKVDLSGKVAVVIGAGNVAMDCGRILAIDEKIARIAGALHVSDPRPQLDELIAATALVHSLTLATRNTADFEPMGVKVFNPWTG